ncbi:MAG: hypothetical protein SV775_07765 [Thermodesulfobacteriota bacterium]|nr:hypothetical protein [Thermodesulfobacteriota bacterium]
MGIFRKKKAGITVVTDKALHFVELHRQDGWTISGGFALDQFLYDNEVSNLIPGVVRDRDNTLLIVPDYWFAINSYKFQSKRRSIVEPFIERTLQAEHVELPDIKYFFDYTFLQKGREEPGLYVCFMQEPKSFQLYSQLAKLRLNPDRITTPAFIWEQRLRRIIADFREVETGLVHQFSTETFLYFFSRGCFLFSRCITLPGSQTDSTERLRSLNYEVNQSLHLFSQKARAEIDRIYLLSDGEDDVQQLSNTLGREVIDLSPPGTANPDSEIARRLGPVGSFSANELSDSDNFFAISHRLLRKGREWKPIQTAGIVVGLILLSLMAGECFFLFKFSQFQEQKTGIITEPKLRQTLREYNEALDVLLSEARHPYPRETIVQIARSLPDNVWIREMLVEVETVRGVELKGVIKASGPDQFRDILQVFFGKLYRNIPGSRAVQMEDIDLEVIESEVENGRQDYLVTFRLGMP